jgi:hypothetical protein
LTVIPLLSVDIDLDFVAGAAQQRRPGVLKDSHAMEPSPIQ